MWSSIDWQDVWERALSTFWQTALSTLPAQFVLDWAVWRVVLIQIGMAAGGAALSLIKNVLLYLVEYRRMRRIYPTG